MLQYNSRAGTFASLVTAAVAIGGGGGWRRLKKKKKKKNPCVYNRGAARLIGSVVAVRFVAAVAFGVGERNGGAKSGGV